MSKKQGRIKQTNEPRLEVASKRCNECLFSSARIVSEARMQDLLEEIHQKGSHFVCHKHSIRDGSSRVCCRGFYDQEDTLELHLARILGIVVFVDQDGKPVV